MTRSSLQWMTALVCAVLSSTFATAALGQDNADSTSVKTVEIWPGDPPEWTRPDAPERDTSGPDSRTVAGKRVVRLGNVSTPELHLYPAANAMATVIVSPGGGYNILAWDLEGTEIAEWFQQQGINAAVLKYRVPTRNESKAWQPPVQDIQRSLSLVRSGAIPELEAEHVGLLGFSAGGNATVRATLATDRLYEAIDQHDQVSIVPDFAILVYAAYLTETRGGTELSDEYKVTENTPPMFFAHAFDDRLSCMGPVGLFAELKRNDIASSLHIFSAGGHGFGARDTGEEKDAWLPLCKAWLGDRGFIQTMPK
jgi:endo-1,4-beta-xylanase